jgi:hypothetical protein
MTAVSMKKKIISKIEQTNNKNLLADIYKLLDLADQTEGLVELTDDQKKSIRRGLRDVAQKKTISHNKANKEVEKWLSK